MSAKKALSRREFLRLAALGAVGTTLAACVTQAPAQPAAPAAATDTEAAADTAAETTSEEAPAAEATTISFWHIWGGVRDEQLRAVLDDFTAANPSIVVEPLLLPNPGYQDKIVTGLAADPPDLMMITTNEFAPAAKRGALSSLDERLQADGLSPDDWYSGIWDMTQWAGETYGIPFVGNFLQFYYWNRDDFDSVGLDPETGPETWDELLNIATSLTTFDDSGIVEHLGYVPNGMGEWMQATYRNGHDWFGDGTPEGVSIDHPNSLAALQHAVEVYNSMGGWDAVGATLEGWGNQQLGNPMIAGVASSILSGIFTVNIINDQMPDLNYKYGQLPHGPEGEALDLIQNSWNMAIPSKAANPDAAWTLAKYLSHGEGHLKFMVDLQGRPAMIKAYNEAPHDAAAREQNPYWDEALAVLNGKQASLPVSDKIGTAQNLLTEAFESVMLEQQTPDEAVSWAQEEVVKLFQEE